MRAYVGSRITRERNARGEGISVFDFNAATGQLQLVQVLQDLVNPSFLALNQAQTLLYCVHGDGSEVSSFHIDSASGHLRFQGRQSCEGRNPVHLALSPDERHLVVSNHLTSSLAVLSLASDGSLQPVSQLVQLEGTPGPHRKEQPFAKPHFNPFDPSGRYVIVADKGVDKIFSLRFESGHLSLAAEMASREGAGPRHTAFHPNGSLCYCINELDNTVAAYSFDTATGQLSPFQVLSSLSESYTGNSRAAEIAMHPHGHTLYASNRGEDSVAVFSIQQDTGRLSLVQSQPCGGKTPRFFTLDPSGNWLLVLNEDSDTILSFPVAQDGRLLAARASYSCASAVCLVFGA